MYVKIHIHIYTYVYSTCTTRLQPLVSIRVNTLFGRILARHAQLLDAQSHRRIHLQRCRRRSQRTPTVVCLAFIQLCSQTLMSMWHFRRDRLASECHEDAGLCYSVLPCVAVCCSVLQCVAMSCSMPKTLPSTWHFQ